MKKNTTVTGADIKVTITVDRADLTRGELDSLIDHMADCVARAIAAAPYTDFPITRVVRKP